MPRGLTNRSRPTSERGRSAPTITQSSPPPIPGVRALVRFGEATPNFHPYARLLSLPKIFDTTLWNIPHEVPYIRPPWGRVEHWRARLANDPPGKRVGLVWAGSAKHTN